MDLKKFVLEGNPVCRKEAVIVGDHFRITMLTTALIRFEYSEDGGFEDRATQMVCNRDFPVPEFRVSDGGEELHIYTKDLEIHYDRQKFSPSGLMIRVAGGKASERVWHYGDEPKDLLGTARTLDEADGEIPLSHGIMSRNGFSVLDDSHCVGKLKAKVTILALAVLCLADMWSVNKRYLYDEQFVEKVQQDNSFKPTETDKAILADKTLDFRVLNLAGNTFNENTTSYWHKSIGGYHAAKLRRYQEMIEEHISTEMNGVFKAVSEAGGDMQKVAPSGFPVLNMLNTRYFIFPLQGGKTVPIQNPYTLGNAWFVNEVQYVDNANEEIDALHRIDPAKTAVVDKKFSAEVKSAAETDTLGTIKLTAYEPNDLKYEVNSKTGGTVVFSEIYYPGWQAYIDGVEAPHGRADYILRAMNVPAGKHVVEFKFDPKSLHVTETVAFVALGVLTCVLVLFLFLQVRRARRKID